MKLLTYLAAALAAGTIGFAVPAHAVQSPRAEGSSLVAPAKTGPTAKAVKDKATKGKLAGRKGAKGKVASAAGRQKSAKAAARGKGKARAGKRKGRERIVIDTMSTAAIAVPAAGKVTPGVDGIRYQAIIAQHAASNGVPVALANAVIRVESNYRADALGSAGEIGLMQIKLGTARMMGYRGNARGLYDPDTNIKYGMKYLGMAHQLGGGATCATILRYNAGHAARRMNPVSAAYCGKVKRELGA